MSNLFKVGDILRFPGYEGVKHPARVEVVCIQDGVMTAKFIRDGSKFSLSSEKVDEYLTATEAAGHLGSFMVNESDEQPPNPTKSG